MGKVLKALNELRDDSRNMMLRFEHGSDMYTRFYIQLWGVNHMIGAINRTIRAKNKLVERIKIKEK